MKSLLLHQLPYEPRCEKTVFFAYAKTKTQISFAVTANAVTAKLISAFVFAIRIVQSFYFLNPKSHASSNLLWLYSLVCVGPGRKPLRPVFSQPAPISRHNPSPVTSSQPNAYVVVCASNQCSVFNFYSLACTYWRDNN